MEEDSDSSGSPENVIPDTGDCPYCDMSFKSLFSLRAHIGHHFRKDVGLRTGKPSFLAVKKKKRSKGKWTKPKIERVSCDVCGHWFSSKYALLRHNMVHTGEKPFECEICKRSFTTRYSLQIHTSTQHTSTAKYSCSDCGDTFQDEENLKDHACVVDVVNDVARTSINSVSENKEDVDDVSTANQSSPLQAQSYPCRFCNRVFPNPKGLGGHMRAHKYGHYGSPNVMEKSPPPTTPPLPERRKPREVAPQKTPRHITYKELFCTVCPKVFKYKQAMKKHILTHSSEPGPFKCPLCNEEYPDTDMLVAHMGCHSNSCPVCNENFEYPSFLERHMRQEGHNLSPPKLKCEFECSTCNEKFTDEQEFNHHMLTHQTSNSTPENHNRKSSREKPVHACITCDTDCTIREALKTPPVSHPPPATYDPGEGSSQTIVKSEFANQVPDREVDGATSPPSGEGTQTDRMRRDLVRCPICRKSFPRGISFTRHKSWHTRRNEVLNLASCPLCTKKYTLHFNLRRHMKHAHGHQSLQLLRDPQGRTDDTNSSAHLTPENQGSISLKRKFSFSNSPSENNADESEAQNPPKMRKLSENDAMPNGQNDSETDLKTGKRIRTAPTSQRGMFKCPICRQAFTWYSNMRSHLRKSHFNTAPIKVQPLPFSTNRTVRRYPCSVCGKKFLNTSGLGMHMKSHFRGMKGTPTSASSESPIPSEPQPDPEATPEPAATESEESFNCTICNKVFTDARNLKLHVRFHQLKSPQKSGELIHRYFCPNCNEGFHYYCRLKRHMEKCRGNGGPAGGQFIPIKPKLIIRPFYCRHCPRRFTNSGTLKNHEKSHIRKKNDELMSVNKKDVEMMPPLVSNSHAETTVKTEPGGLLSCGLCNKTFVSTGNLSRHTKLAHSATINEVGNMNINPSPTSLPSTENTDSGTGGTHSCSYCGKTFQCRSLLMRHIRTHTGEKPHTCPVCGQGFALNWTMTVHMRKLHPNHARPTDFSTIPTSRRYQCRGCPKVFHNHFSMNGHKRHCPGYKKAVKDDLNNNSDKLTGKDHGQSTPPPDRDPAAGHDYPLDLSDTSYNYPAKSDRSYQVSQAATSNSYSYRDASGYPIGKAYDYPAAKHYSYNIPNGYPEAVNGYRYDNAYNYENTLQGLSSVRIKQEPKSDTESVDMEYGQYSGADMFPGHAGIDESAHGEEVLQRGATAKPSSYQAEPYTCYSTEPSTSYKVDPSTSHQAKPSTSHQDTEQNDTTEESPLVFKLMTQRRINEVNQCRALSTIKKSILNQRKLGESGFVLGSIHIPAADRQSCPEGDVMGYLIGHPNGFGPFSCPICYRRFPAPSVFADHLMFHTDRCPDAGLLANIFRPGNKPVRPNECNCHLFGLNFPDCPKCVKGFVKLDELKRHVRLHVENYIEYQVSLMDYD